MNLIALAGSGEYLPVMEPIDAALLQRAAKQNPPRVVCLPTAAGEEGDVSIKRWSQMGINHFQKLGAEVAAARIIDRASADDPQWVPLLEQADLIYFSGGNPLYLLRTMENTAAWAAIRNACANGAVFAGCSAGAMILGVTVPDVRSMGLTTHPAFNIVPNAIILPHYDQIGVFRPGLELLVQSRLSDDQYALGIDENTVLVGPANGPWEVQGEQTVTVMTKKTKKRYKVGETISLQSNQ